MRSVTEVTRLHEQAGFTLARMKNHQVWRCPCGHTQLIVNTSPSYGCGDTNARLRIKRTLRICAQKLASKQAA